MQDDGEEKKLSTFWVVELGVIDAIPQSPFVSLSVAPPSNFFSSVRKPNNIFRDLYFSFTVMLLTVRLSIDSRKLIGRLPAQGQKRDFWLSYIYFIITMGLLLVIFRCY